MARSAYQQLKRNLGKIMKLDDDIKIEAIMKQIDRDIQKMVQELRDRKQKNNDSKVSEIQAQKKGAP
jgi:hypothetical protein